jgi:RNA polymerase sigma factor (sigma-70 family)
MSRDDELVLQLTGPDWAPALATLWDRHQGLFVATARNSTRSDADCEDLLSESFMRLARSAADGKLTITTSFRAYVIRTIKTTSINRRRRADREDITDKPIGDTLVSGSTTQIDLVVDDLEQMYIARAFEQLHDNQREVLYMVEVEGMKPREVAEVLGVAANTVSQIAVRARTALREGWVREHLADKRRNHATPDCALVLELLPAYLLGTVRSERAGIVAAHLAVCAQCAQCTADLRDDTTKLRGLVLPLLPLTSSAAITTKAGLDLGALSGVTETVAAVAKKSLWQARRLFMVGVPATVGVVAATGALLLPPGNDHGFKAEIRLIPLSPMVEDADARTAQSSPISDPATFRPLVDDGATAPFVRDVSVTCTTTSCEVTGDLGFANQMSISRDANLKRDEFGYWALIGDMSIPMHIYRGCVTTYSSSQSEFLPYQDGCPGTRNESALVSEMMICHYPPQSVAPVVDGYQLHSLGVMQIDAEVRLGSLTVDIAGEEITRFSADLIIHPKCMTPTYLQMTNMPGTLRFEYKPGLNLSLQGADNFLVTISGP